MTSSGNSQYSLDVTNGVRRLPLQWIVLEARKLSKELCANQAAAAAIFIGSEEECKIVTDALDSLGYDEAAKLVYGESYLEWKKRHQKSTTEEQL